MSTFPLLRAGAILIPINPMAAPPASTRSVRVVAGAAMHRKPLPNLIRVMPP